MQILKNIFEPFALVVSLAWVLLEPITYYKPDFLPKGWGQYICILVLGSLFSAYKNWPRKKITKILRSPDFEVSIIFGDLFEDDANKVIGVNDVFDTEIGDVIFDKSVQGSSYQMFMGAASKN